MMIYISYEDRIIIRYNVLAFDGAPSGASPRTCEEALLDRTKDGETVGDDGYRRIRADIIFGRLQPDQKLRLEAMKDDYGVSVSTLREILSRLSSEGFVIAEGRRGFEVAPVSA